MVMYGLGFAAVYLLLALMYRYAYKRKNELELDEVEAFMTRHSIIDHAALMSIGLLSSLLAVILPLRVSGTSGFVYWLIPVYYTIAGMTIGKRERLLAQSRSKHARAV
jgi:multisubunit Na+/H+ antiporter MnhB subunit